MFNLAIVGLGGWGRHLVESVQNKSSQIKFVCAYTPEQKEVECFAEEFNLELSDSFESLLRRTDIDAVVLATPNSMHRRHVEQAASAGKHVFVEKPLALTHADALACKQACLNAGVGLVVGYNWRFYPATQKLVSLAQSGAVGDILHIEGNYSGPSGYRRALHSWRTNAMEAPAGAMTGRGIHALNIISTLNGQASSVYAYNDLRVDATAIEDTTTALLRFLNGTTAYIGSCQVTAEYWRLHVTGTQGWVEMLGESTLRVCKIDSQPEIVEFDTVNPERLELEAFAQTIKMNSINWSDVDHAIHDVAVMQAMDASARLQQPMQLDIRDRS